MASRPCTALQGNSSSLGLTPGALASVPPPPWYAAAGKQRAGGRQRVRLLRCVCMANPAFPGIPVTLLCAWVQPLGDGSGQHAIRVTAEHGPWKNKYNKVRNMQVFGFWEWMIEVLLLSAILRPSLH